jgi:hypothetical protein
MAALAKVFSARKINSFEQSLGARVPDHLLKRRVDAALDPASAEMLLINQTVEHGTEHRPADAR